MQIIYNLLIIPLLYIGFQITALFNSKIRKGIRGRQNLFSKLEHDLDDMNRPVVWFHIASYGEFEQAKPVLIKLKAEYPALFILVTFFSPSAYEHIKLAQPVDYLCYLPFDSLFNARRFISTINPRLAVIVRHDIWPNFVWTLNRNKIPVVLIDASIPPKSSRLLPIIRSFNSKLYNGFNEILTINEEQNERIRLLISDNNKLMITGDTKFDQVYQRSLETEKVEHLMQHPYLKNKPIWVIGSSWRADEKKVIPAFSKLIKKFKELILIIVPHEPSEHRIQEIIAQFAEFQITYKVYSKLNNDTSNFKALIIDKMGLLANIYCLGKAALIGGSFEFKVHNVLEPAAHGIPILFGPKITTQSEALMLVEKKAGFIVNTVDEIVDKMTLLLENDEVRTEAGRKAKDIVLQHTGATEKTIKILLNYLR